MEAKDPFLGRRVGHCALQRKLGQGGMGAVYLAHHAGLNKPVAIKILPEALAKNPDFIVRFLREARLAARLEHPNVVQVFDVGQSEDLYYISMQFVEGRSLDALLKERGRLAPNEALSAAKRVAVALEAARRLGIVHRDIKPANILISKDGLVKVADFGLAKDRETKGTVSEPGQIMGTPHYMAPEQARGEAVDHRTDIYALGATLYHMLAGRTPFQGPTSIAIVVKALKEDPVPLRQIDPSIPEGVERLVERLMAKSPDARPATAEEVVKLIDALKSAGPSPASTVIPPKRRAALVALPVAGILAVGIVLGMVLARPSRPASAPAVPAAATAGPDSAPAVPAAATAGPDSAPAVPSGAAARPAPAPPAPKPEPVPEPPKRRTQLLGAIQDAQEKRFAEEVMDRTEALLERVKARDIKGIQVLLDRLTFGDTAEAVAAEFVRKVVEENLQLVGWEFEEVDVRPRTVGRPPHARVTMSYEMKGPSLSLTTKGAPISWVRRVDAGWVVTRAPRGDTK